VSGIDLSAYPSDPPREAISLVFLHHSCGGQLLADAGEEAGRDCIYESHPNGGGLRRRLKEAGYEVHEASYGSRIGARTDVFDWLPKFRGEMDAVLACERQDERLADEQSNRIVVFKSCFPNNRFRRQGDPPGHPDGPELTVWNAKAAYLALREAFAERPDVLFVCVTAPPLAPFLEPEPAWRALARKLFGRDRGDDLLRPAALAREFNGWLKATDGWLSGYPLENVVVFDYYDLLTGAGESDLSRYATRGGRDSHPSREGNTLAARAFVPFLNRAVRRAGLSD
jgi:hypothetical protein